MIEGFLMCPHQWQRKLHKILGHLKHVGLDGRPCIWLWSTHVLCQDGQSSTQWHPNHCLCYDQIDAVLIVVLSRPIQQWILEVSGRRVCKLSTMKSRVVHPMDVTEKGWCAQVMKRFANNARKNTHLVISYLFALNIIMQSSTSVDRHSSAGSFSLTNYLDRQNRRHHGRNYFAVTNVLTLVYYV